MLSYSSRDTHQLGQRRSWEAGEGEREHWALFDSRMGEVKAILENTHPSKFQNHLSDVEHNDRWLLFAPS